jgi:hypothetical protein
MGRKVRKFTGRREVLQGQGLKQFVIPGWRVGKGRNEDVFRRRRGDMKYKAKTVISVLGKCGVEESARTAD